MYVLVILLYLDVEKRADEATSFIGPLPSVILY